MKDSNSTGWKGCAKREIKPRRDAPDAFFLPIRSDASTLSTSRSPSYSARRINSRLPSRDCVSLAEYIFPFFANDGEDSLSFFLSFVLSWRIVTAVSPNLIRCKVKINYKPWQQLFYHFGPFGVFSPTLFYLSVIIVESMLFIYALSFVASF